MSRDEGYIVLTNWVDFKMSTLTTGTINAYLGTWKNPDFCHRGVSKAFTPRIFGNAILKLKGWRRTIDIDLRTQRTQRIFDKCDNHQWPCWKFLPDKASSWGIRSFWGHHRGPSSNWMSADRCEGFTLTTRTQPGASKICLTRDYHSMRKDPKRGYNMILVHSHKRQEDGPAMLSLSDALKMFTWLRSVLDCKHHRMSNYSSRAMAKHSKVAR